MQSTKIAKSNDYRLKITKITLALHQEAESYEHMKETKITFSCMKDILLTQVIMLLGVCYIAVCTLYSRRLDKDIILE